MDSHMNSKELEETDAIVGVLDEVPYQLRVFVMKDAEFNMKLMSTYGNLTVHADAKIQRRKEGNETKNFLYTEPFHNHYSYRHAVDDHNNNRHSDISLEET